MSSNFDRLAIAAIAAGLCGIAIGYASTPVTVETNSAAPAILAGDDNLDGIIDEDESGWNCETMGNGICGPADNSVDECVNYTIGSLAIAICAPNN